MIYAEEHATMQKAIARERQLKRWSAAKKNALVKRDPATLKASSRQPCRESHGGALLRRPVMSTKAESEVLALIDGTS
jgi:hypothetical protein